MLQKALGCLFVFVIAPVGIGALWSKGMGGRKEKLANMYLAGFLSELAVFQLIAVPVMIWQVYGMDLLVGLVTAVLALLSLAGFGWTLAWERRYAGQGWQRLHRSFLSRLRRLSGGGRRLEKALFWLLFFGSLGFQLYMAYAYASFDGDDAYYVVQSVLADQTGVLNRIRPYTGLSTALDVRHAMATLPLWIAYVARLTGIHATIVAHTLLPLFLIPLTYYVYGVIGGRLFGAASPKLPVFLTLVSVMQIWGNGSIYTNATFFLTRTWQGKSVLANLILLVQLWLLFELFSEKGEGKGRLCYWLLLAVSNVAAAMMTSMGPFLTGIVLGVAALLAAIRYRRIGIVGRMALCCIPNAVYLALLLVL
ncbi:MAG: DUF6077 domain-containing protein [Eubacteriales bacterium]|nr:DUF6077 domain-containing protein [Eubacteriales bacterium]